MYRATAIWILLAWMLVPARAATGDDDLAARYREIYSRLRIQAPDAVRPQREVAGLQAVIAFPGPAGTKLGLTYQRPPVPRRPASSLEVFLLEASSPPSPRGPTLVLDPAPGSPPAPSVQVAGLEPSSTRSGRVQARPAKLQHATVHHRIQAHSDPVLVADAPAARITDAVPVHLIARPPGAEFHGSSSRPRMLSVASPLLASPDRSVPVLDTVRQARALPARSHIPENPLVAVFSMEPVSRDRIASLGAVMPVPVRPASSLEAFPLGTTPPPSPQAPTLMLDAAPGILPTPSVPVAGLEFSSSRPARLQTRPAELQHAAVHHRIRTRSAPILVAGVPDTRMVAAVPVQLVARRPGPETHRSTSPPRMLSASIPLERPARPPMAPLHQQAHRPVPVAGVRRVRQEAATPRPTASTFEVVATIARNALTPAERVLETVKMTARPLRSAVLLARPGASPPAVPAAQALSLDAPARSVPLATQTLALGFNVPDARLATAAPRRLQTEAPTLAIASPVRTLGQDRSQPVPAMRRAAPMTLAQHASAPIVAAAIHRVEARPARPGLSAPLRALETGSRTATFPGRPAVLLAASPAGLPAIGDLGSRIARMTIEAARAGEYTLDEALPALTSVIALNPRAEDATEAFSILIDMLPGDAPAAGAGTVLDWTARHADGRLEAVAYSAATVFYARMQYADAIAFADRYMASFTAEQDRMLLLKALCFANMGRSAPALDLLATFEARFPESELLPRALFLQGWMHIYDQQTEKAKGVLDELVRRFPEDAYAQRARQMLEGL